MISPRSPGGAEYSRHAGDQWRGGRRRQFLARQGSSQGDAGQWDFGPAGSTDSAQFAAEYRAALDGPLADGGGHGDSNAAFSQPAKVVEALYEVPYLAHAPMEPLNATAHWRGDRIDVWMGTQAPELALAFAAKAGGVDPKAVFVHNCFLGGGFGRRAVNDSHAGG